MKDQDATAVLGIAPMDGVLCALAAFGALAPGSHLEAQDNSGSFTVHGASLCDHRDIVKSELLSDGFQPTSEDPDEATNFRGMLAKHPVSLAVEYGANGGATRYQTEFPEDIPSPGALFMGIRSGLSANYGEPDREVGAPESAEGAKLVWRRDSAVGPTLLELRRQGGTISIVLRSEDLEALDCGDRPGNDKQPGGAPAR